MSTRKTGDDARLDDPYETDEPTLTFGYQSWSDPENTAGAPIEVPREEPETALPPNPPVGRQADAAGEFRAGRSSKPPAQVRPSPARRTSVPSTQAPVTRASHRVDSGSLTGSTIDESERAAASVRPFKQWTGTLLRLQATRPTSPDRIGHRAVLRAFVCHDGRDVVRYGLYVDPDEGIGFDGSGRVASYSLQLREVDLYRYGIGGPGRVNISLAGHMKVASVCEMRFECDLAFDGTGRVELGKPRLIEGTGRVLIQDDCVVAGWWQG